jgi:hypothetical protein
MVAASERERLGHCAASRLNLRHIDIVVIVTCFRIENRHIEKVDRRLAGCVSVLKTTTAPQEHLA